MHTRNFIRILPFVTLATLLPLACTFDTSGLRETGQNNNNVNNNVNNLVCGNDLRETGEVCDGTDLAGETCLTRGFDGGTLSCAGGCLAFDTSACTGTGPVCGNGVVETPEVCDGTALDGHDCVSEGFVSGTLACAEGCAAFDTGGCEGEGPECGDGVLEGAETCDGTDLGGETCQSQGFAAGTLACLAGCDGFELAGCTQCGNGVINPGELCDGAALGTATCMNQGFAGGGVLACTVDCQAFDTSGCVSQTCGNNAIESPEPCDGINLNGQTCVTQGFYGGTLACNPGCTAFDTSGCTDCGDGVLDLGETCDGAALGGETCVSQGFAGGTLACNASCSAFVTTGCTMCGNNAINAPEVCDGTALGGQTCVTRGFFGGTLACAADCAAFDTAGCTNCGNGAINAPEVCDGAALGGQTCVSQGFAGGTLSCETDCTAFNTEGCTLCGNDVINAPEVCDGTALGGRTCAWYGCRSGDLACVDDCSAFDPADCYDNHDEDGDGVDDNCDNCPTWSNADQADSDGDGLGNPCEATGVGMTQFPYWSPFVTAPAGFGAYGGTWTTPTADQVRGNGTTGANYLHTDALTSPYAVEATFVYPNNGPAGAKYAGVALAGQVNGSNQLTAFFACTYERQAKQIQIWEWNSVAGYTSRGAAGVTTSATNGQWRKVWASVNLGVIVCAYLDETGAAGAVTHNASAGLASLNGRAGLRLYNDTADFRSYIRYR